MKELILGGARSGKSRLAQEKAEASGLTVIYVATAEAHDQEMSERIQLHQQDRPQEWYTIEEPILLGDVLTKQAQVGTLILVDCLTLWLSNLLCLDDEQRFKQEVESFLSLVPTLPGSIIFVSNEVGQGVIPTNSLARRFVDESGWLHQQLAKLCEQVTFVTAGLPQVLKSKQSLNSSQCL